MDEKLEDELFEIGQEIANTLSAIESDLQHIRRLYTKLTTLVGPRYPIIIDNSLADKAHEVV